jgi:hypothetical protein
MPALFPVGSRALALVHSIAKRGDYVAQILSTILRGTRWVEMGVSNQEGTQIAIFGQLRNQDGSAVSESSSILIRSKTTAGEVALTVTGAGIDKTGDGTDGDYGNQAGEVLIEAVTDNGETEITKLTFVNPPPD